MTTLSEGVLTATKSFSFYVAPGDRKLIELCAERSDAVTIRGRDGPAFIKKVRDQGFDAPVVFDREGWRVEPGSIDVRNWLKAQREAGAARLFTPGCYVPWDKDEPEGCLARVAREIELARSLSVTALVAVDARWLSKCPLALAQALAANDGGIAVVLVEPGDPLALNGAVGGLRTVATGVPGLLLLRSDHGALGALAFGARHASLGLIPAHRHGTTPDRPGFGKQGDRSARVFSYAFADWFTAATIAGWALVDPKLSRCNFECCDGADLSRFLDEDAKDAAIRHNVTSLAILADLVIEVPESERRMTFLEYCSQAAERYDLSGVRGPQDPKPQLTSWLLS